MVCKTPRAEEQNNTFKQRPSSCAAYHNARRQQEIWAVDPRSSLLLVEESYEKTDNPVATDKDPLIKVEKPDDSNNNILLAAATAVAAQPAAQPAAFVPPISDLGIILDLQRLLAAVADYIRLIGFNSEMPREFGALANPQYVEAALRGSPGRQRLIAVLARTLRRFVRVTEAMLMRRSKDEFWIMLAENLKLIEREMSRLEKMFAEREEREAEDAEMVAAGSAVS